MAVSYNLITGWPDQVESSLRRTLGALSRASDFHQKVGITANPERRWKCGYLEYGWKRMTVVYQSNSYEHSQAIERRLIAWLRQSQSGGYYYNLAPGGEGRRPRVGPYFVYIVGAPKYCRMGY